MAGAEVLTYGDDGNQMICACVDIGTNTTRLLVAERDGGRLRELVAVRRFLRLVPGEGGAIPSEAVAALAAIVAAHARAAREHGVREVRVVGTAAIRAASNRDELCAAVQRGLRHPRRGPHRRAGGRARLHRGAGHAGEPAGRRHRGDRRRRRLLRARDRDRRRRRHVVAIGADRLRDPGRAPPALRPAGARRARRRPRRDRRRARRASTRPRPSSSSPSAAAPRRWRRPAAASSVPATHRPHPGRPARPSRRPRRRSGWACTSSACACCRRACWRSRRPGGPSARRRCRSRVGGLREGVVLRTFDGRS